MTLPERLIPNTLDQFYTNPDIAEKCYSKVQEFVKTLNLSSLNHVYLEPSAGTGSFYNLLPYSNRVGLDLDPKCSGVILAEYLSFIPDPEKKYIVIGNPPFGRVSSTAVKFFNKSVFADMIAFIVPRTFKRVSIQNTLDMRFHLVYNENLPLTPCCFTPKMSAKCCFQIWIKKESLRESIKYKSTTADFAFMKHGPKDDKNQPTPPDNADFAVKAYGSNCGVIQDTDLCKLRPKSWHWIKVNTDLISIDELKERFRSLDYSISKDTVRQNSLGQKEFIYIYEDFMYSHVP